jgi:hypothetical protein
VFCFEGAFCKLQEGTKAGIGGRRSRTLSFLFMWLWLWMWICYRRAIGLAIRVAISLAIDTPSLLCATTPRPRELLAYLGLLHQLKVCAGIMVTIGLTSEKLVKDRIHGLSLGLVKGAADPVQRNDVGGQRRGSCIVMIEQKPVGAMLDQGKMGGIAAVVARVVGIPRIHGRTPSNSGRTALDSLDRAGRGLPVTCMYQSSELETKT